MAKLKLFCIIVQTLISTSLLIGNELHSDIATQATPVAIYPNFGSGNTLIKTRQSDNCLYLPSHVNYANMDDIGLEDGTIFYGTVSETSITKGEDVLDFRTIFGQDMKNGVKYSVKAMLTNGTYGSFYVMKSEGFSSLFVNLDDGKTVAYLNANIKNECSGTAVKILSNGNASDSLKVKKIAGRGNASWSGSGDKKPYKINLDKKYALISSAAKAKKFALLSCGCNDYSGLRDAMARDFADIMVGGFVPNYEFVDFYINGEYRGMYNLMERVTFGTGRVDVTEPEYAVEDKETTTRVVQKNGIKGVKGETGDPDDYEPYSTREWNIPDATYTIRSTDDNADQALAAGIQAYQYATESELVKDGYGGFCVEISVKYMNYAADSACLFVTRKGIVFTLKVPEYATKEQVQSIAIYFQKAEDALFGTYGLDNEGRHYSEFFDVDSIAKHFIVDGYLGNHDFFGLSVFFYIDADNVTGELKGKLITEPVWDYDYSIITNSTLFYPVFGKYYTWYASEFCNKGDFIGKITELTKDGSAFRTYVDELIAGEHQKRINSMKPIFAMNKARWGKDAFSAAQSDFSSITSKRKIYFGLFANSKILSVSISTTNTPKFMLRADTVGTAQTLQWYRRLADGTIEKLENETKNLIDPYRYGKGKYFCGAYGKNLAYMGSSYAQYINTEYVTLYSAPYDFPFDPKRDIFWSEDFSLDTVTPETTFQLQNTDPIAASTLWISGTNRTAIVTADAEGVDTITAFFLTEGQEQYEPWDYSSIPTGIMPRNKTYNLMHEIKEGKMSKATETATVTVIPEPIIGGIVIAFLLALRARKMAA